MRLQLHLLAGDGAHRSEIVVIEVVMVLVRVAAGARHGLGGQAVVAVEGGGGDLRVGAATTRSGHARIDARHAETVRTRECRGKAVAVAVLWWSGGLAVRGLFTVAQIGRESVYLLFAAAGL